MWTSLLDIFKIGLGPSSSHVVGPMVAARRFVKAIEQSDKLIAVHRVTVTLYGSLALTCQGHGTDAALIAGLTGRHPSTCDPDDVPALFGVARTQKQLELAGSRIIEFDVARDLILETRKRLPRHSNAMSFAAYDANGGLIDECNYYSIGGGFVITDGEDTEAASVDVHFPFDDAAQMIARGDASGLSIADMAYANELTTRSAADVDRGIAEIAAVMLSSIDRGLTRRGKLPGGLNLVRRAGDLHERLNQRRLNNAPSPTDALDWASVYAIAVNEENAAGGRVVTAPTNGAAGVVPSILRYYRDHCPGADDDGMRRYLLTAAAIGGLFKRNASISGAEVGCQGEVGVACSMAAAGLTAALNGTNRQIENAAEIGMEHHLGMTCDPIAGLVQIPCIERNAMGAVKAVAASSLALNGNGSHHVSLDDVIRTMLATGRDMSEKYKETALGGLAVNAPTC